MFAFFKILWTIFKTFSKSILRSIYCSRYYDGVEFFNAKNISLKNTSVIEKGTRLLVINPQSSSANISIKDNCWIGRDVEIQAMYNSKIVLEKSVSVQDRCKIIGDVHIGQDCLLAPDVFLSSGTHHFGFKPALLIKEQDKLVVGDAEGFKKNSKQINIGEDCWIGKNAMVQSGLNIGRGVVIASNSFVRNNIPPYEIWGGSPAKFLKKRLEFAPPGEISFQDETHHPYFYWGFDHRNISEGFLSNNSSVCVLSKKISNISLFLHANIIANGNLKIFINNEMIFDKDLNCGVVSQGIKTAQMKKTHTLECDSYNMFAEALKQYDIISFTFSPENKEVFSGFSIYKLSNNG